MTSMIACCEYGHEWNATVPAHPQNDETYAVQLPCPTCGSLATRLISTYGLSATLEDGTPVFQDAKQFTISLRKTGIPTITQD